MVMVRRETSTQTPVYLFPYPPFHKGTTTMSKMKKARGAGGGRPLPGGGLPGMGGGNMGNLMGQMRKLQEEMEKTQNTLAEEEVTATSGGGMVTVVATGAQE